MTTMKKNYMSPIAEVIGVDLCNMLSSSVGIFDKDTGVMMAKVVTTRKVHSPISVAATGVISGMKNTYSSAD